MKSISVLLLFLSLGISIFAGSRILQRRMACQTENRANLDSLKTKGQNVRLVFWNVENLYDPYDDSTKLDDEFTPDGAKHWNYNKFKTKLNHLSKTILAIGGWEAPAIVGMCEIENRYVLNKLIYETPLRNWKYKCIHHESPDRRGVDVAILYRPSIFKPFNSQSIMIRFPFDTLVETREILMVQGVLPGHDTLTLFVNHWPSKLGGALKSQPRRNYVASRLRLLIDSLQNFTHVPIPGQARNGQISGIPPSAINSNCRMTNIIVMGDFNDEPYSESLLEILKARSDTVMANLCDLVNLMAPKTGKAGTHKFRGHWSILDQFIVSKTLFGGKMGLKADFQDIGVFKAPFLLMEDPTFFGEKPNRTYNGPRYLGGYSDHLPIYMDIHNN